MRLGQLARLLLPLAVVTTSWAAYNEHQAREAQDTYHLTKLDQDNREFSRLVREVQTHNQAIAKRIAELQKEAR